MMKHAKQKPPLALALLVSVACTSLSEGKMPADRPESDLFSPLSGWIVYWDDSESGHDLRAVDPRDPQRDRVLVPLNSRSSHLEPLAWSPDGSRLLLTGGLNLSILSSDGRSTPLDTPINSSRWGSFTPDGREVVFGTCGVDCSFPASISVVDVGGGVPRSIADGEWDGEQYFWPTLSPDGTRIAYASVVDERYRGIWLMDVDGSHRRRLVSARERFHGESYSNPYTLAWSPDGTQLAFERYTPDKNRYDVYVVDADRSIHLIARDASSPHWSPDGSRIAFTGRDQSGLEVADDDGSNRERLSDTAVAGPWNPVP